MAVFMTARFEIKGGAEARVDEAIREFVARIKENEPGTILYSSLKEVDNPRAYLHYFIFDNQAAEAFHRETPWVKRFVDVLYPETIQAVEFKHYQMIDSTDRS